MRHKHKTTMEDIKVMLYMWLGLWLFARVRVKEERERERGVAAGSEMIVRISKLEGLILVKELTS